MRKIKDIMLEKKEGDKKEQKLVFVETDPKAPFPNDCVSAIEKAIKSKAKELETQWKSPMELVDAAFEELDIPKPLAWNKERWTQYNSLLIHAIRALYEARGFSGGWSTFH